jgi:electron transfer flavoprotein alpha subunit
VPVTVDLEKCVGSRDCLGACAFNAIEVQNGKAVIFENCVDCDACVRACPTHAIISSTTPASSTGGVFIVDVAERSGIAALTERAAKRAGVASTEARVDPADPGAAADALAAEVEKSGAGLIVLPHAQAGPAIAARLAAKIAATLVTGCEEVDLDNAGGLRATRLRYGGIVRTTTRAAGSRIVATLVLRGATAFGGQSIGASAQSERLSDAPPAPEQGARVLVSVPASAPPELQTVARAIAQALGGALVDAEALRSKVWSPELYVAIGLEGSTEHNAAVRGAGTIVALVDDTAAPITQAADYVLAGDVREHAQALLSALG